MQEDEKWVFVDDDDPAIVYVGPWTEKCGIETNINDMSQSEVPKPLYGTVHTPAQNDSMSMLWYIFNGMTDAHKAQSHFYALPYHILSHIIGTDVEAMFSGSIDKAGTLSGFPLFFYIYFAFFPFIFV